MIAELSKKKYFNEIDFGKMTTIEKWFMHFTDIFYAVFMPNKILANFCEDILRTIKRQCLNGISDETKSTEMHEYI